MLLDGDSHARNIARLLYIGSEELRPLNLITGVNMAQMSLCSRFLTFGLIVTGTLFGQARSSPQSAGKKIMLSGRVYDTNGSLVMGSDVLARSAAGNEYQGRTNTEGIYKMEVPLGVYKIEANAQGFCPQRVEVLRVSSSGQGKSTVDFVLEIALPATL